MKKVFLVIWFIFSIISVVGWWLFTGPLWRWGLSIPPVFGVEETYVAVVRWWTTVAQINSIISLCLFLMVAILWVGEVKSRGKERQKRRTEGIDILKAEISRSKEHLKGTWGKKHIAQLQRALELLQ